MTEGADIRPDQAQRMEVVKNRASSLQSLVHVDGRSLLTPDNLLQPLRGRAAEKH